MLWIPCSILISLTRQELKTLKGESTLILLLKKPLAEIKKKNRASYLFKHVSLGFSGPPLIHIIARFNQNLCWSTSQCVSVLLFCFVLLSQQDSFVIDNYKIFKIIIRIIKVAYLQMNNDIGPVTFCACAKTPWPRQILEERIYLGLPVSEGLSLWPSWQRAQ